MDLYGIDSGHTEKASALWDFVPHISYHGFAFGYHGGLPSQTSLILDPLDTSLCGVIVKHLWVDRRQTVAPCADTRLLNLKQISLTDDIFIFFLSSKFSNIGSTAKAEFSQCLTESTCSKRHFAVIEYFAHFAYNTSIIISYI